jgi:hypothetical protein
MPTGANGELVNWVHFGDLHITGENERNYRDLLALIAQVNANPAGQINFAVLPGDNADDGGPSGARRLPPPTAKSRRQRC